MPTSRSTEDSEQDVSISPAGLALEDGSSSSSSLGQSQTQPQTHAQPTHYRSKDKDKTIHSFFSGPSALAFAEAGPSTRNRTSTSTNTSAGIKADPSRKRRKNGKTEDGQGQGRGSKITTGPAQTRLSLGIKAAANQSDAGAGENVDEIGAQNGTGNGNGIWIVSKPAPLEQQTSHIGGGGRRKAGSRTVGGGGDGEEDELREMSKKGAAAIKGKGKRAAKRKSGVGGDVGNDNITELIDPSLNTIYPAGPEVSSSPPKKRGRGRKLQVPNSSSIDHPVSYNPSSHPVPNSPPSSPISIDFEAIANNGNGGATETSRAGRHRLSNDFEVTNISLASTAASTPASTISALPSTATSIPTATTKNSHPFFSRTNLTNTSVASLSSKGSGSHVQDAIEVDERSPDRPVPQPGKAAPTGPRKIAFAADQNKPAHSFFSKIAAVPSNAVRSNGAGIGSFSPESTLEPTGSEPGGGLPTGDFRPPVHEREKGKGREKKGKVHSFFKVATQVSEGKLQQGWGRNIKEGEELLVPLPRGDWPNHDTASSGSTNLEPSRQSGPSRRRKHHAPDALDDGFWYSVLETASISRSHRAPSTSPANSLSSIPPYIAHHPAFTSISAKRKAATSNRAPWSDRYRPLRACEVLHNDIEATYIRDWLSTLSVGHQHGESTSVVRRIVRKVKRGKLKSNLLDGWIVDDLGVFGGDPFQDDPATDEEELEELDDPSLASDPDQRTCPSYPPLESRLTNTILLTGPHGSGKSAAVYAAANELGWDVFEVFPGMGKRTGGNLMSWVGDVGRNHMVSQGHQNHGAVQAGGRGKKGQKQPLTGSEEEKKPGGLSAFFGAGASSSRNNKEGKIDKNRKIVAALGSQGSAAEPIDIDDDRNDNSNGHANHSIDLTRDADVHMITDDDEPLAKSAQAVAEDPTHAGAGASGLVAIGGSSGDSVRQSLILLDEVDILFDEESTFWPAVISLIAESRRPVILTCNDHTRVPKDQLPLQAILEFCPPPSFLAIPYLQSISDQETQASSRSSSQEEGYQVDVQRIYDASIHRSGFDDELVDQPLPPNGNERIPYFDLRKAISQLQLDRCIYTEIDRPEADQDGRSISELIKPMENLSYADAYVDLRPWAKLESTEIDRYAPTEDDELGTHLVPKPEINDRYPVCVGNDISSDVAVELKRLAGDVGADLPCLGDLGLARTLYIRSTLPLLDPLIPLSAPLLPNPTLFLYTLPTILNMIEMDDVFERAEEIALSQGEERINRKTGRPVRSSGTRGGGGGGGGVQGQGQGQGGYIRWLADLGVDSEAERLGRKLIGSLR
ncbi:hypothetical protein I316_01334 [Kwoniella heveanensis BCC8398]|uniref:AAA+ ATPase domain-containing protein n=1 Tax=Kwoniella heveanensis BCC8398 TaxID=1296120 RepID=A0A1B9H0C6_9TREE|nr:hypothetical protein I316_01334 [Kwoniella heveanensis BCC8398]